VPTYAAYTGPRTPIETCAGRASSGAGRPAEGSLEEALLAYAADAASGFSHLVREERYSGASLGRRPTLPVPGALSSLFVPAPWGDSITSTMYEGESMADAMQAFTRLEAAIRTLCAQYTGKVERSGEQDYGVMASLTMKTFATDGSLQLTVVRWPDPGGGKARTKVKLDLGAPGVVE
jgi:hypothetical protein